MIRSTVQCPILYIYICHAGRLHRNLARSATTAASDNAYKVTLTIRKFKEHGISQGKFFIHISFTWRFPFILFGMGDPQPRPLNIQNSRSLKRFKSWLIILWILSLNKGWTTQYTVLLTQITYHPLLSRACTNSFTAGPAKIDNNILWHPWRGGDHI